MKKILLTSIIAAALVAGGVCYKEKRESRQYTECLEKYKDLVPGKDYAIGSIILGFDDGITRTAAYQFIKSQNLEMQSYHPEINFAIVKVDEGEEKEYTCYFECMKDETIIKNAELNYIYRIMPIIK